MDNQRSDKVNRLLSLYTRLLAGEYVVKSKESARFGVNNRTFQRDIDDIRDFLEIDGGESGMVNSVIYDRKEGAYRLENLYKSKLTNDEILAVCKILLDSRAFTKSKMDELLEKLVSCCLPVCNQKVVSGLIRNELFHYVAPRHKKDVTGLVWEIGKAISESHILEIEYRRTKDKTVVKRRLKPLAIMFSEYYFYLTAFIDDEKIKEHFDVINDSFPTIYRIDRIEKYKILDEKFHIPYASRFEEGEFRKRVQFMYGGKLRRVEFKYVGPDVDSILDRLPTAEIVSQDGEQYVIKAEVFGKGVDMWLKSQDAYITELKST